MAIRQMLKNMDEYYRSVTGNKIIVNDLNYFSIDDIELVNKSFMTVYDIDVLSTVPSCDCGNISGRYFLGRLCKNCGTECKEQHDKVQPLLWLKILDSNLPFINPSFWLMLRNIMNKKIDYLRWLSDSKYNPPIELPKFVYELKEAIGERSYFNVVHNLPLIIQILMNNSKFKKPIRQSELQILLDMVTNHKNSVYSTYIPIINKKLFVMENTTKGKFINLAVSDVIDIVMMWIKSSNDEKPTNRKNGIATAVVISKLAELYYNYYVKYIVKKTGAFRKHVYGARSHFTFRCVITSIPGRHQHDGLLVPWSIGIVVFRMHLVNKLMKRGYKYKQISALLYKAVKSYDPLIDELLNELISEAPNGKIPIIAQRNPSLLSGSAQLTYISKFKTDPSDYTVGFSALLAKSCNADYDGDGNCLI